MWFISADCGYHLTRVFVNVVLKVVPLYLPRWMSGGVVETLKQDKLVNRREQAEPFKGTGRNQCLQ